MTDIPRGPGGDGSPQLDLDAIERQALAQLDITRSRGGFDREASTTAALVALVRRLQQELDNNARYYGNVSGMLGELAAKDVETVALRGRVEELTEALRALVTQPSQRGWDRARAALARVVPEKETP